MKAIIKLAAWKIGVLEKYFFGLALLAARIYVGIAFWKAGMTKYANLKAAEKLFKSDYLPEWSKNHIKDVFGLKIPFPVPPAEFAGVLATVTCFAELACAALLIVGLAGRSAAFGIFMLAAGIELFIYPGTPEHHYWLLLMAVIITAGPGRLSLDYYIRRKLLKPGLYDKTVDIH